jgi:branched-chain amino acid aminotransferase
MTQMMLGSRTWQSGAFIDTGHATIPIADRGFTLGDGLFETMLWTGDTVRFFRDHMARLSYSAAILGYDIPYNADQIEAALTELASDAQGACAIIRLTLTRGSGPRGLTITGAEVPIMIASLAPLVPYSTLAKLVSVAIRRNPTAPSSRFKTLSYIDNLAALAQARAQGGDDAMMLGANANLACASSANIIIHYQGINLTPALTDGALPGIVRGRLIAAGVVTESHISPDMVKSCTHGALTNAIIGVRGVSSIDNIDLESDEKWLSTLRGVL